MNDGTENIMDLEQQNSNFPTTELETVTIRFAGDSGDGMQLTGNQFTQSSVMIGNDVITFPDYPAEIRAPAGTLAALSAKYSCTSLYCLPNDPVAVSGG